MSLRLPSIEYATYLAVFARRRDLLLCLMTLKCLEAFTFQCVKMKRDGDAAVHEGASAQEEVEQQET